MSEYTPITGELRAKMRKWGWVAEDGGVTFGNCAPPSIDAEPVLAIYGNSFDRLCDAIDAVHAQLERENESLKAELDRVLGEQEEHAHTRGESITDELREYATNDSLHYCSDYLAIADRIDAEHQKALDEWKAKNGQMWLKGYEECHAELLEGNETLASDLESCGWVRLPEDADGVPIRFKDKVTVPWSDKVYEVSGFSYQENVHTGTMTIWINTHIDGEYRALCATDSCHHHAPDSWERIIEELLQRGHDDYPLNVDIEPYVARCKALCESTKEDE